MNAAGAGRIAGEDDRERSATDIGDPRGILAGDFHVHSQFSDDATSTLTENIAAAAAAGLRELRLVDHVRRSTSWVPEFVAAVADERIPDGLTVFTGVEAKLLDVSGALDIPADLLVGTGSGGVDTIVIGDHQFPGTDGPWSPDETRARLSDGLDASRALDLYIGASVRAMESHAQTQLGHWFSILPKVGLSEDELTDDQLQHWATAAARTGTLVEVNEKWGCPGSRAIRAALTAGARIVASTDSHRADTVGRYVRVDDILRNAEGRAPGPPFSARALPEPLLHRNRTCSDAHSSIPDPHTSAATVSTVKR